MGLAGCNRMAVVACGLLNSFLLYRIRPGRVGSRHRGAVAHGFKNRVEWNLFFLVQIWVS